MYIYNNDSYFINNKVEGSNSTDRAILEYVQTDKKSLELRTHEFDMEFISALDMSKYDKKTIDKMYYYLFNNTGLNHPPTDVTHSLPCLPVRLYDLNISQDTGS